MRNDGELRAAVGAGADVVFDSVAMNREHGEQLNGLEGLVGSLVVISTASVYADDEGRALDGEEASRRSLPVPIPETQRTAEPGDATYSTQKAELEQTLLEGPLPATLIRAVRDPRPGREAAARALLRQARRRRRGDGSRSPGRARAASTRRRWRTSPS